MATTAGKQAETGRNSTRTAVAYYRTSSAANVGPDKDSLARQREAVTAYAKAHGLTIVREFYDAAVSGADPIDQRPGFLAMLQYLHSNGARVILLETASRFARDLAVQLAGHDLLGRRPRSAGAAARARCVPGPARRTAPGRRPPWTCRPARSARAPRRRRRRSRPGCRRTALRPPRRTWRSRRGPDPARTAARRRGGRPSPPARRRRSSPARPVRRCARGTSGGPPPRAHAGTRRPANPSGTPSCRRRPSRRSNVLVSPGECSGRAEALAHNPHT